MLYWGFGFLAVALAAFIVGFAAGIPGLGTTTSVAFFLGLVFLAWAIAGDGRRHHGFRHHWPS